jgi:hypothetical protein
MGFNLSAETDDEPEEPSVEQEIAQASTQEPADYELSENVVKDLVKYTRSKTVKNEEQFVLTTLSYLSGFMESPKHYVCYVLIGTAGSGKSHLQNTIEELFPQDYLYQATSGTDKSIIYDDGWEDAYFASLDELQKPSEELIEILKSLHGGEDGEFRYKVTGDGQGADRDVDEIVRSAVPYGFLYAQYEPDFEMWDRLLKIPVHESKEKNDGVARTQWDHSMVSFGDSDNSYMQDFSEGERVLQRHIQDLPKDARVKIPAGEDEFGWDAYEFAKPLFDISRSETNRVSGQIANLVRASALLNHQNREKRTMHIPNEGTKEGVIIASKQDVANILACREVLLATTHQLDRKRKAICLAISEVGGTRRTAPIKHPKDRDGQPKSIMGYLRQTNASFVKRPEIEAMLSDLQDNGLVEKLKNAGDEGRHLYQFQSWQSLGKFDINEQFKQAFADTTDPFNNSPFVETARRLNDELTPSASDFMGETEVTTDTDSQATLGSTTGEETVDVDLAPHEERVAEMVSENLDGEVIDGLDEHEPTPREMLGLVPLGADDDDLDTTKGTILDPDHSVWNHGPDEWVETVSKAEEEIENALRTLTVEGVLQTSVMDHNSAGEPLSMRVRVKDV